LAREHIRTLETTAPPDAVWHVWADPSTWPAWNPNVREMALDGPFAVGTTGTMDNSPGGRHAIRIVTVDPPHSFALETSVLPLSSFTFRCEVQARGSGSYVSQSITMRGPLAPLYSALMGERIAGSFEPLLAALGAAAQTLG
jgi:uncharacterized protein YndB with AHSA1/START domain